MKNCRYQRNSRGASRDSYILRIFFRYSISVPSFIIVGYVWQILRRGALFGPLPHLRAAPKNPFLNRVKFDFSYLNINSIRNKFSDLQQIICDSVDILTIAETKIDYSFPTAQFRLANYHTPYRLDISNNSGGILVYIRSNIPTRQLNCGNLCKSIQAVPFEINLRKE